MPRPPAKRGRRPKGAKAPEMAAAAACPSTPPDDNYFAVVIIRKSKQVQGLEKQEGCTEKIPSSEGHRKYSGGPLYVQGGESGVNKYGDPKVANHQAQTPVSKNQHGVSDLPSRIDATSSATGNVLLSNIPNKGDASSRVQKAGTPAFESLMLSNFRRRPRQPSILHMMQGDQSSELDDDDLLGSFDPDDESTPLKFSNRKNTPREPLSTPSSTSRNLPTTSVMKGNLHPEVQVQDSRCPDPPELTIATDENGENGASEDDLLPPPRGAQSPELSEMLSHTMLPPESSPVSSVEKQPMDVAHGELSENVNSPPRRRKATEKHPPTVCKSKVSTATLRENLLPQRRHRHRGANYGKKPTPDDIESEHLPSDYSSTFEADQDELSYSTLRHSKRRKHLAGTAGARKGTGNKKRVDRDGNTKSRRRKPAIKSSNFQPSTNLQLPGSKKGGGIGIFSCERDAELADKENRSIHTASAPPELEEPLSVADNLPPGSQRVFLSEELMQQTRKFAEISHWQLDFEDATVISCQSSPFR
ncbi:hypothetical protein AJ78_03379 [Emergomyces pasteurianus Ep9510]|uniref:Uncharacterized protein n=1 Tax=Emergomyces pasteurianus Ep9510 TaxID=1447872 RepID=A0A1J9PK53_9EURO|nr:hypothetical protein AJ78_03379 [Emergomyces pasteurianus Ep9510]